jgi:16S rRNA (cytidine1402-2'-O)-methyltransferase
MMCIVMSDPSTPPFQDLRPGLYIVATPIGNLGDITHRAAETLRRADIIAAEDTRVTAKLLRHIGSDRPMTPYHDHTQPAVRDRLVERAKSEAVALVTDAGTPLISDPGFKLVRAARAAGVEVTTLPGPCAAIAALTLSGLPTDRFLFAGFLPAKAKALGEAVAKLADVDASLVIYEAGNRTAATLAALARGLGARQAVVAREITKLHEEVASGTLEALSARFASAPPRGEVVIVVAPPLPAAAPGEAEIDAALAEAMATQPLKSAVTDVAGRLRLPRGQVYSRALAMKDPR